MRRSCFVVVALVLTLMAGLALQPDDGTAVSRPPGVGLKVDGANHAKPLPRVPSVADLLPALTVTIATVLLAAALAARLMHRRDLLATRLRWQICARALARRGPPAVDDRGVAVRSHRRSPILPA